MQPAPRLILFGAVPIAAALCKLARATGWRERLLALGLRDEDLARIAAPAGLDLGSVSAEETALSILAEAVAARHGREGGRLSASRTRIHEVAAKP